MRNVQFIEGANYCENPTFKKGDLFANHLKVNGVGNTIVEYKKRHKRKNNETNRTTQKM